MPNINIDASHTTLTPSMTDYIEKKIAGLQKFLREEHTVHVELDVDNKKHTGPKYLVRITILPKLVFMPVVWVLIYMKHLTLLSRRLKNNCLNKKIKKFPKEENLEPNAKFQKNKRRNPAITYCKVGLLIR